MFIMTGTTGTQASTHVVVIDTTEEEDVIDRAADSVEEVTGEEATIYTAAGLPTGDTVPVHCYAFD